MTQEEKKAQMLAKLDAPAKPVLTQVVRVDKPKPTNQEKEETDHFNFNPPKSMGKLIRLHKVHYGTTYNDLFTQAVADYLEKHPLPKP